MHYSLQSLFSFIVKAKEVEVIEARDEKMRNFNRCSSSLK
jgi:hypothetical protein